MNDANERRRHPYSRPSPLYQAPEGELEPTMAPGRRAIVLAAVWLGLLLLGIQLWLLTVAHELYLGGEAEQAWTLALSSAGVFIGGLFVYRLLGRQPRSGRR